MRLLLFVSLFISGFVICHAQTETDIPGLNKKGKEFWSKRMYHEAEATFLEVLSGNQEASAKELAEAMNGLAVVYRKKGDFVKADSLFNSAL